MISKRFEEIEKQDLDQLVSNSISESKTIEYKQELPKNSDGDKKEFLADISSFANASGGDIIFGVDEKIKDGNNTGLPNKIVGLANINVDQQILRLENVLRDSLDPRINGILMKGIDGYSNGPVLLMRIPNSLLKPHMITFKQSQRFYSRNNAGKYPLDITEIKSAINLSESIGERIRSFRDKRISMIISGETPLNLLSNPKLVIHMIPINSLRTNANIDLKLVNQYSEKFWPLYSEGLSKRFNFDGLLTTTLSDAPEYRTYVQIFNSGYLEAVEAFILRERERYGKEIAYKTLVEEIIKGITNFIEGYKILNTSLPIFILVSLIGVKGYKIPSGGWSSRSYIPSAIDRDILLLPDIILDDFEIETDKLLRPAFNTLWQSANFAYCPHYDDDGRWNPQ